MTVWTQDDIAALMSDDDLGETVHHFPSFGGEDVIEVWAEGFPLSAVFTDSYKAIDLASGTVATTDPMLQFSIATDMPLLEQDQFQVGLTRYSIINIEPDGTGLTLLRLKKT